MDISIEFTGDFGRDIPDDPTLRWRIRSADQSSTSANVAILQPEH